MQISREIVPPAGYGAREAGLFVARWTIRAGA